LKKLLPVLVALHIHGALFLVTLAILGCSRLLLAIERSCRRRGVCSIRL